METNNIKRQYYVIGGILLMLIITNPSRSSFASYLHKGEIGGIGRDFNGLVLSVYSARDNMNEAQMNVLINGGSVTPNKTYYIGVLGNFFKTPTL